MTNEELLKVLRANPEGIKSPQLREIMGVGPQSMHGRLQRMRVKGLVAKCGVAHYTRWCAVEHLATAMEADRSLRMMLEETVVERRKEYERKRSQDPARKWYLRGVNKDCRDRKKTPKQVADDPAIDLWPVVRRWVAVESAPKIAKPRITSVWDLAA